MQNLKTKDPYQKETKNENLNKNTQKSKVIKSQNFCDKKERFKLSCRKH